MKDALELGRVEPVGAVLVEAVPEGHHGRETLEVQALDPSTGGLVVRTWIC